MRFLLLYVVFCLLPAPAGAQKFIQLEKANRARVLKFYVGEDLTYRLKGKAEWYTSTITDVQMDAQMVAFDWKNVRVADIEAIRLRHGGFVRSLGPSLMVFGASWAGFALVGAAFDDYKLGASTAIVSGTGLASGFVLHRIFKYKRVNLSARKRLRAVEIPVAPFPGGAP
ncbi:MAG: hypothetical protein IPH12_21720 [Saprospirales bacterium]|nr:hypothetical protein [Saprospirales bacterium]MBK8920550.1 hypothetical protein [Saprospirales bacterium]